MDLVKVKDQVTRLQCMKLIKFNTFYSSFGTTFLEMRIVRWSGTSRGTGGYSGRLSNENTDISKYEVD